jgi:hypothetical protein
LLRDPELLWAKETDPTAIIELKTLVRQVIGKKGENWEWAERFADKVAVPEIISMTFLLEKGDPRTKWDDPTYFSYNRKLLCQASFVDVLFQLATSLTPEEFEASEKLLQDDRLLKKFWEFAEKARKVLIDVRERLNVKIKVIGCKYIFSGEARLYPKGMERFRDESIDFVYNRYGGVEEDILEVESAEEEEIVEAGFLDPVKFERVLQMWDFMDTWDKGRGEEFVRDPDFSKIAQTYQRLQAIVDAPACPVDPDEQKFRKMMLLKARYINLD